jgi:hypothetical protein
VVDIQMWSFNYYWQYSQMCMQDFFFFFFEGIPLPYFYPYPSPSPFGAATYFLGRTLMLSQPPFRYTLFK